jgi:hypothetical protein
LEPAAEKLIKTNLKDGAPFVKFVDVSDAGVPIGFDPHFWMDPDGAKQYVRTIEEQLQKLDSAGQEMYTTNTKDYLDTISSMQSDALRTIGSVPVEDRRLVTTHSAFGHFASAFGIEIVAVVAGSPGREPSPEDVADLTRVIEEQNIPAVFREPQLDSEGRVLEQAAKDAGVQVCTLYSDSLDDKVTSYIELMRSNADEIALPGGQRWRITRCTMSCATTFARVRPHRRSADYFITLGATMSAPSQQLSLTAARASERRTPRGAIVADNRCTRPGSTACAVDVTGVSAGNGHRPRDVTFTIGRAARPVSWGRRVGKSLLKVCSG